MSSASRPVPRTKPGSTKYSLFWPLLILMGGMGAQACGQIIMLEDQLEKVTHAVDQMDPQVKLAQKQKTKFYSIASHLLRLAPKNANAEQLVDELQLRKLQAAQPALMSMNNPSAIPDGTQAPATNAANPAPPVLPALGTNAAPPSPVVPTDK